MVSVIHHTIFDTGEPAFAVTGSGVISEWNTAASKALGYKDSEAVGQNCWELLQGKDIFGNQYCGERCPLREMAFRRKSVNRCRISFTTADRTQKGFTVSTLVLFGRPGREKLIHMCKPEPGVSREISAVPGLQKPRTRFVLTPRESQVLNLLSEGRTTRDIATLMSISVPTVRNHIEHILHKLHVHSRLEAVAVGRRLGMV